MGWQAKAAREVESSFLANLRLTLSDAEGAMLRSRKEARYPELARLVVLAGEVGRFSTKPLSSFAV